MATVTAPVPLPVIDGGTGSTTTLNAGGLKYAVTTTLEGCTSTGTSGYFLKSNGASAPTWAPVSGVITGLTPGTIPQANSLGDGLIDSSISQNPQGEITVNATTSASNTVAAFLDASLSPGNTLTLLFGTASTGGNTSFELQFVTDPSPTNNYAQLLISGGTPITISNSGRIGASSIILSQPLGITSGGTGTTTGGTTTATSGTTVARDSQANIMVNNETKGYSVFSADGLTHTLLASDPPFVKISGGSTPGTIFVLPSANAGGPLGAALPLGFTYTFDNNSGTQAVTIQRSGGLSFYPSPPTPLTVANQYFTNVFITDNSTAGGLWDAHTLLPTTISANYFVAGPPSGPGVAPQTRTLVAADLASTTSGSTAKNLLISAGSGSTPTWTTIDLASSNAVGTSILGSANGGTGVALSGMTTGGLVYATGASTMGASSTITLNNSTGFVSASGVSISNTTSTPPFTVSTTAVDIYAAQIFAPSLTTTHYVALQIGIASTTGNCWQLLYKPGASPATNSTLTFGIPSVGDFYTMSNTAFTAPSLTVTNPITIANGGTGKNNSTLTANGLIYADTTSTMTSSTSVTISNSNGVVNAQQFNCNSTVSSSYSPLLSYNANLPTGGGAASIIMGNAATNNNSGVLVFTYSALNSLNNTVYMGLYGSTKNLSIDGNGVASAPSFTTTTNSPGTFILISSNNPGMTTNDLNVMSVGLNGNTNNSAVYGFKYSGSSGSASNLGFISIINSAAPILFDNSGHFFTGTAAGTGTSTAPFYYDEGVWTPAWWANISGTATIVGATYSARAGTIIRAARMVTISAYVRCTNNWGGVNVWIQGLPSALGFAFPGQPTYPPGILECFDNNANISGQANPVTIRLIGKNENRIDAASPTDGTTISFNNWTPTGNLAGDFSCSFTYPIA